MNIAIVGSSQLSDQQAKSARHLISRIVHSITEESSYSWFPKLISGAAVGVDSIAEGECDRAGWGSEIFPPANLRWEPNGFKDRNLKIAEACDVLYCIRAKDSKTYGSGWTADRAEEMGKPVWRFYV